jgi:hypothetical protein
MSFTDPQSITVSGTPISMPLTKREGDETEYTSSDGLMKLSASHNLTAKNRARRVLRIDTRKVSADPYKPAENVDVSMSTYLVFDIPSKAGYTPVEVKAVSDGFIALLSASSGAIVTKLLAGES